jgi:hypothetical protein
LLDSKIYTLLKEALFPNWPKWVWNSAIMGIYMIGQGEYYLFIFWAESLMVSVKIVNLTI